MLTFQNISVEFQTSNGTMRAVDDVTLTVGKQRFVCFVGPSGCGKTTLLNTAASLVAPSRGRVLYKDAELAGFDNRIGYVTQTETLFPWRTTADNVGIALELKKMPKAEARARVLEYLRMVGLENFEDHYPRQLSGGMRRRAALARTWIYKPETVLMDEPFGALDAQLKLAMQKQLLDLWEINKSTVVFVTHDLVEAVTLADEVVVFSKRPCRVKAVKQISLPRPRDPYALHFSKEVQEICAELWELLEDEFKTEVAQ
jgi:NitT/TauT family transport system ATP-binding protein